MDRTFICIKNTNKRNCTCNKCCLTYTSPKTIVRLYRAGLLYGLSSDETLRKLELESLIGHWVIIDIK